jgi:hypothetical protein
MIVREGTCFQTVQLLSYNIMQHLLVLFLLCSEFGSIAFFLLADTFSKAPAFNTLVFFAAPAAGYVGHLVFMAALRGLHHTGNPLPTTVAYFGLVALATAAMNFLAMDENFVLSARVSSEVRNPLYVACLLGAMLLIGLAKVVAERG